MTTLRITDIIGTSNAILQKFGFLLFDKLDIFCGKGDKVIISFEGINAVTTGFMNASFGNLYKKYGADIENLWELKDLIDDDWKEKLEDAKMIALSPEKAKIATKAIDDLFN